MRNYNLAFYDPMDPIATAEFVTWAYRIFLQRNPSSEEIDAYLIEECHKQEITYNFLYSPEFIQASKLEYVNNTFEFQELQQLIFLHIPKSFGTSFLELLKSNYFSRFTRIFRPDECHIFNRILEAQAVAGHVEYGTLKKNVLVSLYASVVRDPVMRAFSLYQYWCTCADFKPFIQGEARRYPWYMNEGSMLDTLTKSVSRGACLDNVQCRHLSGHSSFEAVLEVFHKENFLVGCFDYPQEFVNTIARLLHWSHWSLPRKNAANVPGYKQRLTQEPGLVELLTERNQEDLKLYEYVKSKIVVNTIKPDFDLTPLYPSSAVE